MAAATSSVVTVEGDSVTAVTWGALFWMVTVSLTGVPVSVPSLGVIVQVRVSPRTKTPARVSLVPRVSPSRVHAKVELSVSPSGSLKPTAEHVRVSSTVGVLGLMLAIILALGGEVRVPISTLLVLAVAPTVVSLLKLALSRQREFARGLVLRSTLALPILWIYGRIG